MTYAQIFAEALRLMFATGTDDFAATAKGISGLIGNPNYRDYLLSMPGSVNRCFADLTAKGVIPHRIERVDADEGVNAGDGYRMLELHDRIPDCGEIVGVMWMRSAVDRVSMEPGEDYYIEGDELYLPVGWACAVYYAPTLPYVDETTDLDAAVPLSLELAAAVPYFIKSELYRQEEPHEASEALNLYEHMVALVKPPIESWQRTVKMVYGF